jgi:uncharacterized protein (DUF2267 family)
MAGFQELTQEPLVRRVGELAGLSDAVAHPTLVAVLAELGGALTWGESQNLAERLPPSLAAGIRARALEPGVSRYSAESFVRLVSEDLGVPSEEGRRRTRAVLEALCDQLHPDRFHALVEELPTFAQLLPDGRP